MMDFFDFLFSAISKIKVIFGFIFGYCILFIPVFFISGILIIILKSMGILSYKYSDFYNFTAMAIYTVAYWYFAIDYFKNSGKYKSKRRAYDQKVYQRYIEDSNSRALNKERPQSVYDDTNSEWLETRRRELAQEKNK